MTFAPPLGVVTGSYPQAVRTACGYAPPLALVTGAMDLAPVHGGFGPSSDPFLWQGACYSCGKAVACVADYPLPECVDCMRHRHGIVDRVIVDRTRRVPPVISRIEPVNRPVKQPVVEPAKSPSQVTVLRRATELAADDPALPGPVRRLRTLAVEQGHSCRLTAAVATDDKGMLASAALRVRELGYAVYSRREGGWSFAGAVLADPFLRRANVGQFEAALLGAVYVPPEPRPAPQKVPCPSCGAEVSLTKDGKIYASHKCKTAKTEGRS